MISHAMISDALRIDFRQCLFRFAKSSLLVCAVSLTITRLVSVAVAQDPFDDQSSNPAPRAATSSQNSGAFVDSNETNAVVRSLRANPPTTPREIAQAVGLMTRIRRWDETARWLDKLAEQPIDGPPSKPTQEHSSQNNCSLSENLGNSLTTKSTRRRTWPDKSTG
jgi:hypothetical protein